VYALRAFVAVSSIVAVSAIFDSLTHGLTPAYPYGMHKNAVGALLGAAFILTIAAPWRLALRPIVVRHLRILFVLGVIAAQSRGAALALVAVIAIYAIRHREARRAPIFFLVVTVVLIIGSAVTLKDEYKDNPKFNAIDQRTNVYDVAIDVWEQHPLLGGGLRWFQSGDTTNAGPHNLVIAELSETGLIGTVGLLLLIVMTIRAVISRRDALGEAAFLLLMYELFFASSEILWVAGGVTMPMLFIGLAMGEEPARLRDRRRLVSADG
jgi:O-antigen ligase